MAHGHDDEDGNHDHGHDHDHGDLMAELIEHFEPVLEHCPQGVYIWVDDDNMVCNEPLADLFGCTPDEWASKPFLESYVDPKDQEMFANHYGKSIGELQGPVRFKFKAVRADGKTFLAETDMIPITFGGHAVAYHFVRKA